MIKRIDPVIEHDTCWLEIEYAFVDSCWKPIGSIEWVSLLEKLQESIKNNLLLECNINALGGFKEEVFKHQIEMVTHPWLITVVENAALELHDILLMLMKEEFGLIPSPEQPVAFPGGWVELLTGRDYFVDSMSLVNSKWLLTTYVTDRSYYKDAIEDIMWASWEANDSFAFAWNASTSSIHLHRSRKTPEETLKLRYALMHTTSIDILENPNNWREKYGMSHERYAQWSKIVWVREMLWEVMNSLDTPLIPALQDNWKAFCMDRYFPEWVITDSPKRDHGPWAVKAPWGLTVEWRTFDGPWIESSIIKKAIRTYTELTHESIDRFNSSQLVQWNK